MTGKRTRRRMREQLGETGPGGLITATTQVRAI